MTTPAAGFRFARASENYRLTVGFVDLGASMTLDRLA
jgi:hypothetical protein